MSDITDVIPGVAQAKASAKLIIAGIALAGIAIPTIGWTVTAHTLKGARQTIALDKANMAAESNAHQVTIQSLGQCNAELSTKSAESDARAKALTDSTASYQADLAKLKAQGAATADRLAYWSGMAAKYQATGKCPIDAALARELNR